MKTFEIRVTEDEVNTLLMGLRYLEMNHPEAVHRPDFRALNTVIQGQLHQTELFAKSEDRSDKK